MKKNEKSARFSVAIDPRYIAEMQKRGYIHPTQDGRMFGLTGTMNRSLEAYLRRKKE